MAEINETKRIEPDFEKASQDAIVKTDKTFMPDNSWSVVSLPNGDMEIIYANKAPICQA